MSGELIYAFGTQKVLESAGLQIANNTIVPALEASYDVMVDGAGFPDAVFVLACSFGVAPVENTILGLYARILGVNGASNADAPETTRPGRFIGSFAVNNVTTVQTMEVVAQDLPRKADYYLYNVGTGQSVNANWSLKVTPRSYKTAA